MKNKNRRPRTEVLGIKPWVLFRAIYSPSARSFQKVGILVKNLEDNAHYEFIGRSAFLWLLLDGARTVDQVVQQCKKRNAIKDPKFPALACKFLEDLLETNLVIKVSSHGKKDKRAFDMKEFLSLMHMGQKRNRSRANQNPFVKKQPGDRSKLLEVKKSFSKLFKSNARISVKRHRLPFFGGRFHIFKSELSWPGLKMESSEGFGAALTVKGAAMAAIGEAVERSCLSFASKGIYSKSFCELLKSRRVALDPESYRIFSPNQEVMNLSRQTKTNWTLFEDAIHVGKKILIPSELSGARFTQGVVSSLYDFTSSGCAADLNQDRAKLKAALELIERDGVLFYWRTRNTPAQIDLSKPSDRIGQLLEMMGALRERIKLYYLKSELAAVTIQATLLGNPNLGEPRFASTAASRLNVIDAIEKALLELLYVISGSKPGLQSRTFYGKNFDNSIWDFDDHGALYWFDPIPEAYKFLFPRKPSMIRISDIPSVETGNSKQDLKALAQDFNNHGLRLYYQDITSKYVNSAGFCVYRAFSPDLIAIDVHHRFRGLAYPRYYKLPKILGLKRKPNVPNQLSSWPHPVT